jgi:ketosteroid isomerase-like protein
MSQENVEIVRRQLEAFQAGMERGDPGAPWDAGINAVDAEWIVREGLDGRTVWVGREGFVEFMRTWTEQFDDWSLQVERLIDAGDEGVVALTRQWATGKASGVPVELNLGMVYELKDGCVIRMTNYLTHAEALEAAGLSE